MVGITFDDWLIPHDDCSFQSLDDIMNDTTDFQLSDATLAELPLKEQTFEFQQPAASLISTSMTPSITTITDNASPSIVAPLTKIVRKRGLSTKKQSLQFKQPTTSTIISTSMVSSVAVTSTTSSCMVSPPPAKMVKKRGPTTKTVRKREADKSATISSTTISSTGSGAVSFIPKLTKSTPSSIGVAVKDVTPSTKVTTPLNTPLSSNCNEIVANDGVKTILDELCSTKKILDELNGTISNMRQGMVIYHSYMRTFHQRMARMERLMNRLLQPQISLQYLSSNDDSNIIGR